MMKRLVRPEPGRQPHAAGGGRHALPAERDHVLAEDAGAGAGPADMHAAGIERTDALRHRRAAERGRQAQLVAAGEEDAGGLVEPLQAASFLGIAAHVEIEHTDFAGTQLGEQPLVARTGIEQLTGRRNHHDIRGAAATQLDKTLENPGIVLFFLGTADGNDPSALLPFHHSAGTHLVLFFLRFHAAL